MKHLVIALTFAFSTPALSADLKAKVESNDNVDDLVKALRKQFSERGHTLAVTLDDSYDVRIVAVSENSLSGSQATIVVLSRSCEVLTAVTRSGRLTSGGAFNAAAKEIVKRLESIGAFSATRQENDCS